MDILQKGDVFTTRAAKSLKDFGLFSLKENSALPIC